MAVETFLLCVFALFGLADAQSVNLFSSLLSDALSVFTVVTSAIGATPTSTSVSSTSVSSGAGSTSGISFTSASATAGSASLTASSGLSAASSSGLAAPSSSNEGNKSKILGIALGCGLGVLLILLIIAAFLCVCHRRRRRRQRENQNLMDDDFEKPVLGKGTHGASWRNKSPPVLSTSSTLVNNQHRDRKYAGYSEAPTPALSELSSDPPTFKEHEPPIPVPPVAKRFSPPAERGSAFAHANAANLEYAPRHSFDRVRARRMSQPGSNGPSFQDNANHHDDRHLYYDRVVQPTGRGEETLPRNSREMAFSRPHSMALIEPVPQHHWPGSQLSGNRVALTGGPWAHPDARRPSTGGEIAGASHDNRHSRPNPPRPLSSHRNIDYLASPVSPISDSTPGYRTSTSFPNGGGRSSSLPRSSASHSARNTADSGLVTAMQNMFPHEASAGTASYHESPDNLSRQPVAPRTPNYFEDLGEDARGRTSLNLPRRSRPGQGPNGIGVAY